MLSFTVRGGADEANQLVRALRLITPAVGLGSVDTLIQHPASQTRRIVDEDTRDEHSIHGGLLRLSVGLEDVEDLWSDLAEALQAASARVACLPVAGWAMTEHHSHIVIGGGGLGVASAYWLAKAGVTDVLVLEQYAIGHDRGASEDHSRIIRHSYHSPDYTALTPAAYDTWHELEDETGLQLIVQTGGVDFATVGTPGIAEIDTNRNALRVAGIPWQDLDAAELRSRFPQWNLADDVVGMYQEETGLLDIRRASAAHVARARAMGVTFAPHTTVTALQSSPDHVTVCTDRGDFVADHVVVCVASWLARLAPSLGLEWDLALSQEQVTYFATPNVRDFVPEALPGMGLARRGDVLRLPRLR